MLSIKKLDTQSLQDQVVDNIEAVEGRSLWQDAWARFRKNRAAMTSVYVLTFITLCIT
ncbi:peptide ABC transporter permease, partial [Vibrio sp. YT-19(2023)]|nr:peptide ABC transporter permease [Vibrio sp. YT-19(2023)]